MTQTDVQNFINKWMNKFMDYDGAFGPQCVDLFKQYNFELVKAPNVFGNARDYWYRYPNDPILQKYYNRIPNTTTAVPKLGDVIIWDGWKANPYGHIALGTNAGNMWYFTSFDQNWPTGSKCHYQSHNFYWWSPKVLGWLRPKSLV